MDVGPLRFRLGIPARGFLDHTGLLDVRVKLTVERLLGLGGDTRDPVGGRLHQVGRQAKHSAPRIDRLPEPVQVVGFAALRRTFLGHVSGRVDGKGVCCHGPSARG
ncbi:hypothetical protein SRU_1120 [Salinibacter ruber DSM 13855]|uniref:Uncharacterized protein n=1 Tax=Salinibacter ruber (strain DSM 13855 / M31) TaxID=309807 RepID=Q2S3I3_SALRD|nr:hypothetical protein SRU_1120 [Salinibacter ruber DSM 13855]